MSTQSSRFTGKVAFITGGGSGIGRATALRFAREGADITVVGLSDNDNRETVRQVEAVGARGLAMVCDVTKQSELQALVDALRQTVVTFGGLDIAFNNAGIEHPPTPDPPGGRARLYVPCRPGSASQVEAREHVLHEAPVGGHVLERKLEMADADVDQLLQLAPDILRCGSKDREGLARVEVVLVRCHERRQVGR